VNQHSPVTQKIWITFVKDQVASVHLKNINSLPVMGKFPGLIQGHHLHYNTYRWVHDEYLHGHLYEAG
jgi:hypothetical protein